MGRRGTNNLDREFMGSVTARVIGHTSKDVLVIPEKSRLAWGNILLSTDGSASCDNALARSLEIAQERGSKLAAVSVVYTNDESFALGHNVVQGMYKEADKILNKVKSWAGDLGVQTEVYVKEGEPHQAVVNIAAELASDVIVLGSHGRKGLMRLLMGSVTERVIGYANCPVLVCH
jgi:nucleotide-binding universal stress UspA family protein